MKLIVYGSNFQCFIMLSGALLAEPFCCSVMANLHELNSSKNESFGFLSASLCSWLIWDLVSAAFSTTILWRQLTFMCRKWTHCTGFGHTFLETCLSLLCTMSSANLHLKMLRLTTIMDWSAFSGSIGITDRYPFVLFFSCFKHLAYTLLELFFIYIWLDTHWQRYRFTYTSKLG